MNLTIVKLGGSLLGSPDLDAWLLAILEHFPANRTSVRVAKIRQNKDLEPLSDSTEIESALECSAPVVIVPGGGSFADHVRHAQARLGFDDKTAHRMALLAMDQVAVLLASRSSRLALAASRMEIDAALGRGEVVVWLPSAMGRAASDVPERWDVTSDSFAAWLAGTLGAGRLLLVKSRDVEPPVTARDLADAGIVDPLFPRFAERSRAAVFVAGPASLPGAGELLRSGGMPGVPLTPDPTARS